MMLASLRPTAAALLFSAVVVGTGGAGAVADDDVLRIAIPFGFDQPNPDPAIGWNGWRTGDAGITETLFWLDEDLQL